jgi:cell division protein FtsZ
MSDMGKAMMGTGEASGDSRAIESAEAAISNPLLDDVSMSGARGVLISIAGGPDLTLYEVDEAATRIREEVDVEANIIVGATIEEELEGTMRVSVVATGLQEEGMAVSPDATAGNTNEQHIYAGGMGGGLGQAYGAVPPVTPEPAPEPAAPVHEAAQAKVETSGAPAPGMVRSPVEEKQAALPLEEVLTHETQAAPATPPAETAKTVIHHEPAPKAPHIPPLEEFPESIQKTAAAKAEQINSIASAPKKRRSLLERLKKLGRGGDAPAVEEQHTAAEEPRITPRDVHPAPAPDPAQTAAENVHHLDTPAGAAEGDDYTIPAFLRRQQN